MSATLSLLLLFKASLLALGASRSPALNPRCLASTTISGANEEATITTVPDGYDSRTAILYVHPDPGFNGISLVAEGDGRQRDAWFTLDNTCFPLDSEWWRMKAGVVRPLSKENNLTFYGEIGKCNLHCYMEGLSGDLSLNVVAHGPSRLRFTDPKPCTAMTKPSGDYINVRCTKPPAPKTPPTTNNTNTTTTTLSPALDQRCPADTTISLAEGRASTTTGQTWGHANEKKMYVQPDLGFKGVILSAAGNGWEHDTWFTLDNTCFPQDADWWKLWISVERELMNNNAYLRFRVSAGKCTRHCSKSGSFPGHINVKLVAQGPSRWRLEVPSECNVVYSLQKNFSERNCIDPRVLKTSTSISTTDAATTTNAPKMNWAVTVVVVLVVIIVLVGGVVVVVVAKRRIRQGKLRVQSWSGLSACWGVGGEVPDHNHVEPPREPTMFRRMRRGQAASWAVMGEAADDDNYTAPPRVAAVLPRIPPRRGLVASSAVRGEAADASNQVKPPRVPTVFPRVPPRRGLAVSWAVRGEAADDDNHAAPPRVAAVLPRVPPWQEKPGYLYMGGEEGEDPIYDDIAALASRCQYKDVGSDDTDYLPPRRASPGIPAEVMEDEVPIYDEIAAPAFCRQYKDVNHDNSDYLNPRRAPPGTPSEITGDEEPIYDEIAAPAFCRQYKDVDYDDRDYLTPRRAPTGTLPEVTEDEEPFYDEITAPAFCPQYKDVDYDDSDNLFPRRAPPGTPSRVTEEEEHIYDEF